MTMNKSGLAVMIVVACAVLGPTAAAAQEAGLTRSQKDTRARETSAQIRGHVSQSKTLGQAARGPRIIRGDDVRQDDGEWAWAISMRILADSNGQNAFTHWCGGSYISPIVSNGSIVGWRGDDSETRWVVTAAHCFFDHSGNRIPENRIVIRSGSVNLIDMTDTSVEKVILHGDYNDGTVANDIALIKTATPGTLSGTQKRTSIRLPRRGEERVLYAPYAASSVMGWGRTENNPFSTVLQHVKLPFVELSECRRAYSTGGSSNPILDGMICAGYSTGAFDSCSGDSGGPMAYVPVGASDELVTDSVLIGIVSWGRGCAAPGAYGVYSSVRAYLPWIERTVLAN